MLVYTNYSQTTRGNKKAKKTTMEYFDIKSYKDWEIDEKYSSKEDDRFLKNGNDRVRIIFDRETIDIKYSSIENAFGKTKVYYSKSKSLKSVLFKFYDILIGINKEFDENGKLIREIDYDKPYIFTLKDVITKVKKEYDLDLEDKTQGCSLERFESYELNDKPLYGVYLRNDEDTSKMKYIAIDGITGETLFKDYLILNGEGELPPYYKYLKCLKKTEQENKSYYKTYEGKDYTKEEWEAFEEKWYEDYKKKKNSKGFWDDIFKRP